MLRSGGDKVLSHDAFEFPQAILVLKESKRTMLYCFFSLSISPSLFKSYQCTLLAHTLPMGTSCNHKWVIVPLQCRRGSRNYFPVPGGKTTQKKSSSDLQDPPLPMMDQWWDLVLWHLVVGPHTWLVMLVPDTLCALPKTILQVGQDG